MKSVLKRAEIKQLTTLCVLFLVSVEKCLPFAAIFSELFGNIFAFFLYYSWECHFLSFSSFAVIAINSTGCSDSHDFVDAHHIAVFDMTILPGAHKQYLVACHNETK